MKTSRIIRDEVPLIASLRPPELQGVKAKLLLAYRIIVQQIGTSEYQAALDIRACDVRQNGGRTASFVFLPRICRDHVAGCAIDVGVFFARDAAPKQVAECALAQALASAVSLNISALEIEGEKVVLFRFFVGTDDPQPARGFLLSPAQVEGLYDLYELT